MRVTSLIDNRSGTPLAECEHGLSLYIETGNRKILFDTGQTDMFSRNAAALGIDLSKADICVISHGHYDHGGGLKKFLEINERAPVYMSRYAFEPHYNGEKYIGLDTSLKDCGRIIFTEGRTETDEGIVLYSSDRIVKKHFTGSSGLTTEENGVPVPDDFRHEQFLEIEDSGRKILFSGCSHNGILDISDAFRPDILIGGFHFSKLDMDDVMISYAEYLDTYTTSFYTCHCTGYDRFEFMKKHMGRLYYLSAGETAEI